MTMQQYVANRIISLCEERRMPINQLAHLSAIPPSTLKSIINGASKNPGILTIKLICDGLGIGNATLRPLIATQYIIDTIYAHIYIFPCEML